MKKVSLLLLIFGLLNLNNAFSEEDHSGHDHGKKPHAEHKEGDGHDHGKKPHAEHKEGDGHDHGKKHDNIGHKDHDDHKGHDDHKEGDDGHDHGGGKAIGKGKAIVDVDEKKGFKLSKEAIKTLKLKLNTVDGSSFKIKKKTLVASKNKKGVYRFRAGYFKFMQAKIIKELPNGYMVEVKGVDFGDQIVVNGVGLLRVTDVYSTDKSEYGHSH